MNNIFIVKEIRCRYKGIVKLPYGKRHWSESTDHRYILLTKRRPRKRVNTKCH